jgi:WD40 repeat protein
MRSQISLSNMCILTWYIHPSLIRNDLPLVCMWSYSSSRYIPTFQCIVSGVLETQLVQLDQERRSVLHMCSTMLIIKRSAPRCNEILLSVQILDLVALRYFGKLDTIPDPEKVLTHFLMFVFQHCAGINCLSYLNASASGTSDYLFTGSRDGTLKRWEYQNGDANFSATFESHVDWVCFPWSLFQLNLYFEIVIAYLLKLVMNLCFLILFVETSRYILSVITSFPRFQFER